ncbi:hypothetical protein EC991_004127 [Linnemannia zychae]|nr:hypothetical protein EC991_004127 [Linnemannia zychae]
MYQHSARTVRLDGHYLNDVYFQAFQANRIPAATHFVETDPMAHGQNTRVVLERKIIDEYHGQHPEKYMHPGNPGPPPIPPTLPFDVDYIDTPSLDPLRIMAYPSTILIAHFPEDNGTSRSKAGAPGPRSDDDEDMSEAPDNSSNTGQGGSGNGSNNNQGNGDGFDVFVNDETASFDDPQYYHMAALLLTPMKHPPIGSTRIHPSRIRYLFALPIYAQDDEGNTLPLDRCSWKVFRVCACASTPPVTGRWNPHLIYERSYSVIRGNLAARFLDLFGPHLASNTSAFLTALRKPLDVSDTYPAPMSDRSRALGHLCAELGLGSNDATELYLQETINDLNSRIASSLKFSQGVSSRRQRLTRSDFAVFSSFLNSAERLLARVIGNDADGVPGAYLTASRPDPERFVCGHHYRLLYPNLDENYIGERIGLGEYNVGTGKFTATVRSENALTNLLNIESAKVGFVSEFNVTLEDTEDWEASVNDVRQLNKLAVDLGIGAMTMSSHTTGIRDETEYVRRLLKDTIEGLIRVRVVWDFELDVSTLLKEVSETRQQLLFLSIKDGHQEVSSGMQSHQLGVSYIKSSLDNVHLESEGHFLAGRAQILEIPSDGSWNPAIQDRISQIIAENLALTALVLDCKSRSHEFIRIIRAMDAIREVLDTPNPQGTLIRQHPFRYLVLKDRTDNDVTAMFDFLQDNPEDSSRQPVALDVTARFPPISPAETSSSESSGGTPQLNQSVSTILRAYSGAVRTLHLIGPTSASLSLLGDLLDSAEEPENLESLTLRLDHLRESHVESLDQILSSSKNTFKQLTLVGRPQDSEDDKPETGLLRVLENLDTVVKGVQIVVAKTQLEGVDVWIAEVEKAIKETSSTFVIVDSARELAESVPSLTEHGIAALEHIFVRSKPESQDEGATRVDIRVPSVPGSKKD